MVFPEPRKPVIMVIGMGGGMVIADVMQCDGGYYTVDSASVRIEARAMMVFNRSDCVK